MMRVSVPIVVSVESPFLFPGLQSGQFKVDVAGLRDAQNRAILPGDQLRGVLRAAIAQMYEETRLAGSAELIAAMFGPAPTDAARPLAEDRSAIVFSDLAATLPVTPSIYSMVSIDEQTGAAKTGHLQQIELLYPAGQKVDFVGKIEACLSEDLAKGLVERLKAASSRIGAIGAKKSAGFGFVSGIQIGSATAEAVRVVPIEPLSRRLQISFGLDRPFIVNADRIANNVFQSARVIPGGTIKGALARKLQQAGHDPRNMAAFSDLHIGHARPRRIGAAAPDRVIPLSVVHVKASDRTSDFLVKQDVLATEQGIETLADWKPASVAKRLGNLDLWPALEMSWQARAHVRIGSDGTAEEEMLFFTNAVDPVGRTWDAVVDFSKISDDHANLFWGALQSGLDGVGSTNARLNICNSEPAEPFAAQTLAGTSDVIVTLETDGILGEDVERLSADDSYRAYWKRVLGAELVDFAARQDLRGGFIGHAYGVTGRYKPYRVTCAGSAFRLRSFDPARLSNYLRSGLPAPTIGGMVTNWKTCPFQPENGWGEIRADWGAKGDW